SLDISFPTLLILMASTLAGSAVSGMTGLAGGTFILAVIASVIQTEFIIPLHAAVAFMSNGTRIAVFYRHVKWRVVAFFVVGMLPGALIGINVFRMIDTHVIKLSMGIFILVAVFLPVNGKGKMGGYRTFVPVGFFAGLLGIFFGSIGPLIARFFLRSDISKEELVGTKAACQAVGHLVKIPLFGMVIGANVLQFGQVLIWLGVMVVAGVLAGKLMLHRISERVFRLIYKGLLAIIALRIIIVEMIGMWS
ncbi:sulfite exporter TauE/SafE family protein, partial [bacterium]|nr:sulfite exporter TauE/SafE family protein [bacterium]